ncbi:MAG: hypothetical protein ABIF77_05395, partial [bacterium]
MVGGSGLIVAFDEQAQQMSETDGGIEALFTGAGHGLFQARNADIAESLASKLVQNAHANAMDIRIGTGVTAEEAIDHSREYPYVPSPEEMSGPPCYLSGLYPHDSENAGTFRNKRAVNARVFRRLRLDAKTKAADAIDQRIWLDINPGEAIAEHYRDCTLGFFRAVNAADSDDEETRLDAVLGQAALGKRNRWAVICMDGNNIGAQFEGLAQIRDEAEGLALRQRMSREIDGIGRTALATGISQVLKLWKHRYPDQMQNARDVDSETGITLQIVPVRPLIAGGDDLVVLCHPGLAFDFVESVCDAFAQASTKSNEEYRKETGNDLWPATGGQMTISAGITFTSVTFPLHLSIPFTEELLKSAKQKGHALAQSSPEDPAPPCLDWESLTEGLVDGLAARRRREYTFIDADRSTEGDEVVVR